MTTTTTSAADRTPDRVGRRRAPQRTAAIALAAIAPVLAIAAGCGDDDDSEAAEATTTTSAAAGASAADTIEIAAVDYAFEDLPDSVDAGTELTLRNDSTTEVHELVAFRLPEGEDRDLDELMQLPEAELDAILAPPPVLVVVAPPGDDAIVAVGDGTLAEPGRYVLLCAIPTGADPAEFMAAAQAAGPDDGPPEVAGGPPHFVHGMIADLDVH
jgi:hypothetical protein